MKGGCVESSGLAERLPGWTVNPLLHPAPRRIMGRVDCLPVDLSCCSHPGAAPDTNRGEGTSR